MSAERWTYLKCVEAIAGVSGRLIVRFEISLGRHVARVEVGIQRNGGCGDNWDCSVWEMDRFVSNVR
jgi:hypothetical protein